MDRAMKHKILVENLSSGEKVHDNIVPMHYCSQQQQPGACTCKTDDIPWWCVCPGTFIWREHGHMNGPQASPAAMLPLPADHQIKIGHLSHDKWTTIVTSAKQHQLIPRERPALVLKDDPRGSSFKGEIFGPHSILMKGSGIFKNTLGSPLAVLNGPTSCIAALII